MRGGQASARFASWRRSVGFVVVEILLLGACSRSAPVPAPANLTVAVPFPYGLSLRWTPTCGDCIGYELQSRTGAGDWTVVSSSIPAAATEWLLDVHGWDVPELSTGAFRLRAMRSGSPPQQSAWSNEADYTFPVRAPAMVLVQSSAETSHVSLIDVSWSNLSAIADAIQVEREATPAGPWTSLPVAFGETAYRDYAVQELVTYEYRVRYGKGGNWSEWSNWFAPSFFAHLPLRQPSDPRATVTSGSARVTWTNWSAAATGIVVHTSSVGVSPTLSPAETAWVDPVSPPWPTKEYWVEAVGPLGSPTAAGPLPVAKLDPFRLSGAAATLDAGADGFPVIVTARDQAGAFYGIAYVQPTGERAIASQVGAIWELHSIGSASSGLVGPGLTVDGAGHPHVVAAGWPTAVGTTLTHHWYDGTAWHQEDIGPLPILGSSVSYGVEAGGLIHIAYLQDTPLQLVHGTGSGGTWSWAPVPGVSSDWLFRFAVAPDGTAYLLERGILATLPPGGAWTTDPVPSGLGEQIVPWSGGRVGVVDALTRVGFQIPYLYVERNAGVWGAPETIAEVPNGTWVFCAGSPDGSRLHVIAAAHGLGSRVDLFVRQGGAWSSMPLVGTGSGGAGFALGYAPAGKLWIEAAGALWQEP